MIEVTNEMREEGGRAANVACFAEFGAYWNTEVAQKIAVAAYRAMRALEPVPPELRNRQAPPANLPTLGGGQKFAAGVFPPDRQTRVFDAPLEAEMDAISRRIDALTRIITILAGHDGIHPDLALKLQAALREIAGP